MEGRDRHKKQLLQMKEPNPFVEDGDNLPTPRPNSTCDFCGVGSTPDNLVELWPWRSVIVSACMKCAEGWHAEEKKEEAKVVEITSNEPHKTSEVICVKCGFRWIAVRHVDLLLKDIHCEKCGPGFVIETGEDIGQPREGMARIKDILKTDPLI